MFITAELNLSAIGALMRENPSLVQKITLKDGSVQQRIKVVISDNKGDKYGNDIAVSCKPKDAPYDPKYYVGKGRIWNNNMPQSSPAPVQGGSAAVSNDDPPF